MARKLKLKAVSKIGGNKMPNKMVFWKNYERFVDECTINPISPLKCEGYLKNEAQ